MTTKASIFLVEDDQNFGAVLKAYLEMNAYQVIWVDDGQEALPEFNKHPFDICILDVMLPNLDGISIAEGIKRIRPEVPFIFLTAKTLKEDVLRGYASGADDYVTKPFDSEVLLCKVDAILARAGKGRSTAEPPEVIPLGRFAFHHDIREIRDGDKVRKLSPKESELLLMLCQHKNEVLPRDLALRTLWGEESYFTTRSMDVYVTKLRKYLKEDPDIQIMNIHGNGFRLLAP